MLQTLDALWKDHLLNMDHLKEGIGLRGYGQKNPLQEYQKEGFDLFELDARALRVGGRQPHGDGTGRATAAGAVSSAHRRAGERARLRPPTSSCPRTSPPPRRSP